MKTKLFLAFTLILSIYAQIIFAQDDKSTVEPKEIIKKYIDAIGGEENLKKITDRTTIMRGTAMEQTLTLIIKQKAPNKFRQEIKVAGMDQVLIFDGEKAIMKIGDQKMDVPQEQLKQLKIESAMELLLNPEEYGVTFTYEGKENVNDRPCQVLKMTTEEGVSSKMYFDDETGLKVLEKKSAVTPMGQFEQTVEYSDYKEVSGIKFPHKLKQSFGPQTVEVTVSSIKVNTNISDDIFTISE
jgi:outer membrane lipoprotein-sorting protein